jgi:HlyD family secretion protein
MRKIIVLLLTCIFFNFCESGNIGKIKAPGIVEGDIITLKSQVLGTIDRLEAQEGGFIEEGETVAQINADKPKNQLKDLEITTKEINNNREKLMKKIEYTEEHLKYLEKQVRRFNRLKKIQSIPGEKLENMELKLKEVQTLKYDLERSLQSLTIQEEKIENQKEYLKLILKDHTVTSPVKGLILETFVSKGENVSPNTSIADILDTSSLYVEVYIEESEISLLTLNQRANIQIDGKEKRTFTGKVIFFGQKAEFSPKYIISEKERQSLLYRVKIKIDKEIQQFKIGMPVTVSFEKND